jgi:hypothetical protein
MVSAIFLWVFKFSVRFYSVRRGWVLSILLSSTLSEGAKDFKRITVFSVGSQ